MNTVILAAMHLLVDLTCACYEDWNSDLSGWMPMDYLELIYDGISFTEEFGDQFVDVNGTLDGSFQGQTIYLWQYPGSETCGTFDLSGQGDYPLHYSEEYTDAEGNRWGWCAYFMGYKGYWINLDDPTADFDSLFPNGPAQTQPETEMPETDTQTVKEIVPQTPGNRKQAKMIAVLAVAAVVAVTGVLLVILKRKK